MTPGEMGRVLLKCSAVDGRELGEADTIVWYEIAGQVNYQDALAAVTRYYAENRARMYPSDLLAETKRIRQERERHEARHPVRDLPSRFEQDPQRDARGGDSRRLARQIAALAASKSVERAMGELPPVHMQALLRARDEKRAGLMRNVRRDRDA
jgi:hypothetical protein